MHSQKTEAFAYRVADEEGNADPRHEPLVAVFRYIRGQLTAMVGRKVMVYDFPDLQQVVRNDDFMKALWSFTPPESVVHFITTQSDHRQYELVCSVLRTIIFQKYFNTRMALTIVTTRSEDDAFDMFEALNTTGEPLTAFETFKPKIIEAEGLEGYEQSSSHQNVSRIEQYLDAYKKADDRQRATSEMLIPFRLAEVGEKLQKNLNDQRRFLRDYFDRLQLIDEKRDVVASLANLSALVRTGWSSPNKDPAIEGLGKIDDETGFCLVALRELKHGIVLGPLSRFYDEFRRASETHRAERRDDLLAAIRASARPDRRQLGRSVPLVRHGRSSRRGAA